MTPTAGRQHRLWIIRSSLKPSSFARALHKRRDAANNFSKTRLCWRTGGGPSVIPPFSGCLDASHALAHSGHNQRRDFGSRRQRAFTAALRIAFRAPSDVGATSEILSDSSRVPNRQVRSFPRPSQKRSMRIHVSAVSSTPIVWPTFRGSNSSRHARPAGQITIVPK
jgi:hypothetical protein